MLIGYARVSKDDQDTAAQAPFPWRLLLGRRDTAVSYSFSLG